jgi:hypothetical protein
MPPVRAELAGAPTDGESRSYPVGAENSSGPVTCGFARAGGHAVMDLWNCAIHPNRPVAYLVGAEYSSGPVTCGFARAAAAVP